MSGPTAYSDADFIAPQALVISDGKPFKSPAVNTVASTFWYYVASTIFMALCVTQDVLKLSQLRKVSTILVLGHVFVFLLAIFRHSEEAPIRVLCRKIKRGRIAVVLKGLEPSAFNSDPQAARAFERAVEACVSGAVTVTEAKADENANRCTVTFTITSPGEEEPGGGQGDLARALRDGSFLAELRNSKLPALKEVPVKEKNGAMIDKIDRIDKTEFEKLYAAGGKELLEAAVFEAIDGYFKQEFEAPDDVEDPWERFRSQFCALETFWLEPVSAPHERKSVEIWLALEEIAEIRADLEKQVENAKEGEKKFILREIKKLDEAKWDESKDLWYQPAFARLTHEEALEKLRKILRNFSDWRENRRSADGQPTRWNWLRRKAKKRADELENKIKSPEKSGDHFRSLCKELGEVLAKPGNPQQPLLQRDAAVTEAALRATEACIENDPDALAKSKKRIDETVLPPLLRAFAFNCFPLLKDELGKIKDKVEKSGTKIELICDEEKSVKATKRMVAKMCKEIAGDVLQAQEDENTRWEPVSASVRDVLRATFVCETPKAMRDVFEALKNAPGLELKKLKNKAIEEKIPFNLHAVYEFRPSPESVSILVEIQIHDKEIRKNSHAQHKFYEITRAGGSNDLLKVAARGDSDSEDLVKQEDMEKIAKRKSYFSRARLQAAMKRVRSGLRGTKRLEARTASARF